MNFIETLLTDLALFLRPLEDKTITHEWLVVAIYSFIASLIALSLSWGVYVKHDKNILDVKEYNIPTVLRECMLAMILTMLMYILKVVAINPISVFFVSAFWSKVFIKFMGTGDEKVDKTLENYNNQAE